MFPFHCVFCGGKHHKNSRDSFPPILNHEEFLDAFSLFLSNTRDPLLHGHPAYGVEFPAVEKEDLRVVGSRRILRFFQNLSQCRAHSPDIEIRMFLVSNWTNRGALNHYFGPETVAFEKSLHVGERSTLTRLWNSSEFNNQGFACFLIE